MTATFVRHTQFHSSFLRLIFSSFPLPFSFFHKKNWVPYAIERYNFHCLPTSFRRRGTKTTTSGHEHLGKFTPCPLNGFLLAASNTTSVEFGETKRAVLGGKWEIITGHHISESRTSQMSSRTIGAQDNHFLHLCSTKESSPSMKIVVNSVELAEAMLTVCDMNTQFLLLTIAGCQYSKMRKDSPKFLVKPGGFVHQG